MAAIYVRGLDKRFRNAYKSALAKLGINMTDDIKRHMESTIAVAKSSQKQSLEYCDRCDGCGWYEGGVTIKTKCERCDGTGLVKVKRAIS